MQLLLNGQAHDVADGDSVAQLLQRLEIDPRQCAVEVNESLIPRSAHASRLLQAGDRVEVVTLVGGG